MVELLALLLPVAAASGWYVAQRSYRTAVLQRRTKLAHTSYTKGVQLLLQDKTEEALEALAPVIESDGEGLELRLAVGHLYRKKGFVETALAIHRDLAAQPGLSKEQRDFLTFQLGLDYLAAGLLDRAESAFTELTGSEPYRVDALRQLLKIYQHERDWLQAIRCLLDLRALHKAPQDDSVAQMYCELADEAMRHGDLDAAETRLSQALEDDPRCVRAYIARAGLSMNSGEWQTALDALLAVEQQAPAFIPEIQESLLRCFEQLRRTEEFKTLLFRLYYQHGSEDVACTLAEQLIAVDGSYKSAREFLAEGLTRSPSAKLSRKLLSLIVEQTTGPDRSDLALILRGFSDDSKERRSYLCTRCGFRGNDLYWQCPSCQSWETVEPKG